MKGLKVCLTGICANKKIIATGAEDDDILILPTISLRFTVGEDNVGITMELNPATLEYVMTDKVFLKRYSDFYCERAIKGLKVTFKNYELNMPSLKRCINFLKKDMPLLIQKSLNFEIYYKDYEKERHCTTQESCELLRPGNKKP